MIDSRSKNDLRPDFAAVCDEFDARMLKRGYRVAYASTLRDDEKQAQLYAQGRTTPGRIVTYSKVTTFHGVGLAADIYQNAPTFKLQWQDAGFWAAAKAVRKELGFTELSSETAHMQWDNNGLINGALVRLGMMPPPMPLYKVPEKVNPSPVLKLGSTGQDVVKLQQRLNALKFPCGQADGAFGRRTQEAVKAFQAARGLIADGVVGPATWKALFN